MVTLLQEAPEAHESSVAARAFRTIITHVSADVKEAPRLKAAASLARKFDATLVGVGCETMPPISATDPSGLMQAEWIVALRDVVREDLKRAHELFLGEAQLLKTEWVETEELPIDAMTRLSRGADLIVAGGAPGRIERYRSIDAGELMLRSGRPVLVVPTRGGELAARAVVVAWKDTREARRALADALPLLQTAEQVRIVEVCREDEVADAEARTADVVRALARHDVNAQARIAVGANDRVAYELNVAAHAVNADLIVAGGYGHSRLGEWFFGGVTRDLLHSQERFVLLSH